MTNRPAISPSMRRINHMYCLMSGVDRDLSPFNNLILYDCIQSSLETIPDWFRRRLEGFCDFFWKFCELIPILCAVAGAGLTSIWATDLWHWRNQRTVGQGTNLLEWIPYWPWQCLNWIRMIWRIICRKRPAPSTGPGRTAAWQQVMWCGSFLDQSRWNALRFLRATAAWSQNKNQVSAAISRNLVTWDLRTLKQSIRCACDTHCTLFHMYLLTEIFAESLLACLLVPGLRTRTNWASEILITTQTSLGMNL